MEYLKERLNLDNQNGICRSFYNDYDFNKDIAEELQKREVNLSFTDDESLKLKRLKTKFHHPTSNDDFERAYNKLVIELADELQELKVVDFDILALSIGIIVDPDTYQHVTSFGSRY